jgi:hypothetical protein
MTLDLALFALALLLGVVAAVVGRRRPPVLDAERLLKVSQACLLWGCTERAGGGQEAWVEAVHRGILYHPAGRGGWAKLTDPGRTAIPVPSLPGERALVEDLARLDPGTARLARFFSCDEAQEALLGDPVALGPSWEPAAWLGHGCTWDGIAAWDGPVRAALARRIGHLRWAVLAAGEDLAEAGALASALQTDPSAAVLEVDPACPAGAEALGERLLALAPEASDRVALCALSLAGPALLCALAVHPALRDRTVFLLFVGCPLAGIEGGEPASGLDTSAREAWLAEHFRQEALDTELLRSTPYATLARLDGNAWPPGDGRSPWSRQRFAEPPIPPSGRRPVAVVDLGAAPTGPDALPPEVFARSLGLLAAFLLGPGAPRA